jgi:hypothetical protein
LVLELGRCTDRRILPGLWSMKADNLLSVAEEARVVEVVEGWFVLRCACIAPIR